MKQILPRSAQRFLRTLVQKSILAAGALLWIGLYLWWRPAGVETEKKFSDQKLQQFFSGAGVQFKNLPWEDKIWVSGNEWMVAKNLQQASAASKTETVDEFSEFMGEMTPADHADEFPENITGFFRILYPENSRDPTLLAAWNARGDLRGFHFLSPLYPVQNIKAQEELRGRVLSAAQGLLDPADLPDLFENAVVDRLQHATDEFLNGKPQLKSRLS